jgi:tetratricopeptide (TPR) repeat protein
LTPNVHPERKVRSFEPSDAELAEYAVLLSRLGSLQEAFWTLDRVNPSTAPEALLFRAQFHFSRWEYDIALPLLRRYLESPLGPYARLVGNVNLAAALTHTQNFTEALARLDQNIAQAREGSYVRLWMNCLELKAEVFVQLERYSEAAAVLAEAGRLLNGDQDDVYSFYIEIWRTIIAGIQSRSVDGLMEIRKAASEKQLWERVREIDLYICKIKPSPERLRHLVFGTPYPAFRRRVCQELNESIDETSFTLGVQGSACLDITTGNLAGLSVGKKVHQLLDVLLRDFYRPASIGSLFSELCPGERFDASSSPDRIHMLITRTRAWLRENDIPVLLNGDRGGIQLEIIGDFSFQVPLERVSLNPHRTYWARLQKYFAPGANFTAGEARELLGMKPSNFKTMMQWARDSGLVERFGRSVQTKYRMK